MKTIVKALVEQTQFLESWEGAIDVDGTVKILEGLASTLQGATPAEIAVLRTTLQELMVDEEAAAIRQKATVEFYRKFLYMVGIDATEPGNATSAVTNNSLGRTRDR